MDVEVAEVRDFLAEHHPFGDLPPELLSQLSGRLQVRYHRRGTPLLQVGVANNHLYILRSGAVDVRDAEGELVERCEPGASFGSSSLSSQGPSRFDITTIEDSLVLVMDAPVFRHLVDHVDSFRDFFDQQSARRLSRAVESQSTDGEGATSWLRLRVEQVGTPDPVSIDAEANIRSAAQLMTERRISALLVTQGGQMAGILTDRDIRSKVVASGLDTSAPVSQVMTRSPVQVEPGTTAVDALVTMTAHGIHHLPVVDGSRAVRMVTAGDLVRLQQTNPVFLVTRIMKQDDVEGLSRTSVRSQQLAGQLLDQGASAEDVHRLLTSVADAVTRRLVDLGRARLGPEPGPWAWLALGSQGRREISVHSDQDTAIVVADGVLDLPGARDWFDQMATWVTQGLERCGQPLCPGDVMATNPRWRLDQEGWLRQFEQWTGQPDPDNVLNSQISFDARTVVGPAELFETVRRRALSEASQSPRFLGHLAAQAVGRRPPTGFFRGLVLAARGERDHFDVKAEGLHAIIETARVHALSRRVEAVGTLERLEACQRMGMDSLQELADAFRFLSHVRLVHQARQVEAGHPTDNIVTVEELSPSERRHLKDVFSAVRDAQQALEYGHQTHLMR
ncbi:DUF294 nucleotidyltransferase-like domain-containing protein [Luteococcus sp.]|uniref:DUF294 nucleotidyltransferase-like domain-containing protein n=1 Tax=Luteococcus sp. TaxID=1969402 RepID=UPI0037351620